MGKSRWSRLCDDARPDFVVEPVSLFPADDSLVRTTKVPCAWIHRYRQQRSHSTENIHLLPGLHHTKYTKKNCDNPSNTRWQVYIACSSIQPSNTFLDFHRHRLRSLQLRVFSRWSELSSRIRCKSSWEWWYMYRYQNKTWRSSGLWKDHFVETAETRMQ